MLKNQSITKIFLSMTVAIAILLSATTAAISILMQYREFEEAAQKYEDDYVKNQEALIQNEVNRMLTFIEYEKSQTEKRLRNNLKEHVQTVYETVMNIYDTYQHQKSEKEIKALIINIVAPIRHHGNEYYWIMDPDGSIVLHPFIQEKFVERLPEPFKKIFYNAVNASLNQKEGAFYEYYRSKPGQQIPLRKIAYLKFFEPYNWIIGTGAYLHDLELGIQQEVLKHFKYIHFGREGYMQIFTFDGTVLLDPSENFPVGENVLEITDINGKKIVQHILEAGLQPEGGYVSYTWKENGITVPREKLVFSKTLYDWGWIITAEVFVDEIHAVIAKHREVLKVGVIKQIEWSTGLFVLVLMIGIIVAYAFSNILDKEFQVFITFFNNMIDRHTRIDTNKLSISEFKLLADFANNMRDEIIRSHQELSESEKRYRSLVQTIPHGMQEVDLNGRITFVNAAYCKMYGYKDGELIGKSMFDMLTSESEREALQKYVKMLVREQPEPIPYIGKNLRKDGSEIDVQVDWEYERNKQGEMLGFISIITDITERKQAEEKIQQLNRTLEQKIETRTRELQESIKWLHQEIAERERVEQELQTAKDTAEAANQAKSEFLANMSHELRTPLNAILGFAQLMGRTQQTPEEQESLDIIQRSGEYLLTLINQVLDLSKIEAGRTTLNAKNFDLYYLLDELYDMFRLKADEKRLYLLFERTDDVPQYVCTDEVKLRQVLINLLSNAVKFTEEGEVRLKIENCQLNIEEGEAITSNLQSSIYNLQFSISDTGSGIAPDELDSLFEAFTQTKTGQKIQEGTGLGLVISQKFIQLMGGDITVKSEVGHGTTFTFDIQVDVVETAEIESARPTRKVIAIEPGQPRYRMLIVDDELNNRKLLVSLLTPFGFELQEASNGQEAIDLWKTWEPHLIWMDMRMPVLDGYEATKYIKSEIRNSKPVLSKAEGSEIQTIIIAVTASSFEEERAVILEAGCDDFLRKPFREAEIFDLLHKHLRVRFVYEEPEQGRKVAGGQEQAPKDVLTLEAIAALPDELRTDLQQAVEVIDMERANSLIEQIRQQNGPLAEGLAELVKNYRFDILQGLFEKISS